MSFFNPSLLLSSYEATNQSSSRVRKSSCASLDSWVFDVDIDDEFNNCTKPDNILCHMSISLEDKWLQYGRDDISYDGNDDDGRICSSFPLVSDDGTLQKNTTNTHVEGYFQANHRPSFSELTCVESRYSEEIDKSGDNVFLKKRSYSKPTSVNEYNHEYFINGRRYPLEKDESKSFLNHFFPNQRTKNNVKGSNSLFRSPFGQGAATESTKCRNLIPNVLKHEHSANKSHKSRTSTSRPKRLLDNQQQFAADDDHVEVKTKISAFWNSMKYGWRMKREVNLKIDTPIWLLGQYYHSKLLDVSYGSSGSKSNAEKFKCAEAKEYFKQDLKSRIWLTYRLNFPAIPGTDYINDCGWGCMLRAGQMMMAQSLLCHFLSRAWRLSSVQTKTTDHLHRMIIRWFGDALSSECPFSIHHLVCLGKKYGRKVGDWYGPTHAAHVLRNALFHAQKNISLLNNVCMYVAPDGIVFKQDVIDLCSGNLNKQNNHNDSTLASNLLKETSVGNSFSLHDFEKNSELFKDVSLASWENSGNISECTEASESLTSFLDPCPEYDECVRASVNEKWHSLILFVSVRLGNEKLNPYYVPCLKSLLAYENCTGIIGGRPKHAVYFVGWQDEKLIHMDPHYCQPAVNVEKEDFNAKSFHCSAVRTMSFTEMDPSCTIGFYFRTRDDFDGFADKISEIVSPMKNMDYPVFTLVDGRRNDMEDHTSGHALPGFHLNNLCKSSVHDDGDDYIML